MEALKLAPMWGTVSNSFVYVCADCRERTRGLNVSTEVTSVFIPSELYVCWLNTLLRNFNWLSGCCIVYYLIRLARLFQRRLDWVVSRTVSIFRVRHINNATATAAGPQTTTTCVRINPTRRTRKKKHIFIFTHPRDAPARNSDRLYY